RTAKVLYPIIQRRYHLDIFKNGSGTHTAQRNSTDFVAFSDQGPTVAYRDIFEYAGIVLRIISSIFTKFFVRRNPFDLRFCVSIACRNGCFPQNDQTAPFFAVIFGEVVSPFFTQLDIVEYRGENDRLICSTFSDDLTTTSHYHG